MKVAVTYENGEVFQHFGKTQEFKIYEISDNKVVSSEVVSGNGAGHGQLVEVLQNLKIESFICGGIGTGAKEMIKSAGITLYPGVTGNADDAIQALIAGNLKFDIDTSCNHHGHDGKHEHNNGHECTCGKH